MTIKRTTNHTIDGLAFDEAEANARGIFIEADDTEHDHPLLRAARMDRIEFDDDIAAWAA